MMLITQFSHTESGLLYIRAE